MENYSDDVLGRTCRSQYNARSICCFLEENLKHMKLDFECLQQILFRQDCALEEMYFVVHGLLKTIRTIQLELYSHRIEKPPSTTASTSISSLQR